MWRTVWWLSILRPSNLLYLLNCCTYVVPEKKKAARFSSNCLIFNVARRRFELPTSGLWILRSTRLSYAGVTAGLCRFALTSIYFTARGQPWYRLNLAPGRGIEPLSPDLEAGSLPTSLTGHNLHPRLSKNSNKKPRTRRGLVVLNYADP